MKQDYILDINNPLNSRKLCALYETDTTPLHFFRLEKTSHAMCGRFKASENDLNDFIELNLAS